MKLPLWLATLLTRKQKDNYISKIWDDRTDEDIIDTYEDATDWIRLSKGIMASAVLTKIAADCQQRLDKFILPQIEKRELIT